MFFKLHEEKWAKHIKQIRARTQQICELTCTVLETQAEELYPYSFARHSEPCALFGNGFELKSPSGVQQGDVCGPARFFLQGKSFIWMPQPSQPLKPRSPSNQTTSTPFGRGRSGGKRRRMSEWRPTSNSMPRNASEPSRH